jgi:insulin-like growth factor 2 mRNA-binding protein 1
MEGAGHVGATTRGISQATRARDGVDVQRNGDVCSVEKAITIYGNPKNCSLACKRILEVISQEDANTIYGYVT